MSTWCSNPSYSRSLNTSRFGFVLFLIMMPLPAHISAVPSLQLNSALGLAVFQDGLTSCVKLSWLPLHPILHLSLLMTSVEPAALVQVLDIFHNNTEPKPSGETPRFMLSGLPNTFTVSTQWKPLHSQTERLKAHSSAPCWKSPFVPLAEICFKGKQQ